MRARRGDEMIITLACSYNSDVHKGVECRYCAISVVTPLITLCLLPYSQ